MYITHHARQQAQQRFGWSECQTLKATLRAIKQGKRSGNWYIHNGVRFVFNNAMDTLKTVY